MTEFGSDPARSGELPAEARRDLAALRDVTGADLVPLSLSVSGARSRTPRPRGARLGGPLYRNRLLAAAFAGFAGALAVLVIPVSYERTTGQRVSLTLLDMRDAAAVRGLAGEFAAALHAGPVFVHAEDAGGGMRYSLEAAVSDRNSRVVAAVARAFAERLTSRGRAAVATTTPIRTRSSGSVYAFARDRVIEISVDGKSDKQLAAEIRRGLADAGLPGARVSVSQGAGGSNVTFDVDRPAPGTGTPGEPGPVVLQLTHDGTTVGAGGLSVQEKLLKTAGGTQLHIEGHDAGRSFFVDVPNAGSLRDAELAARVTAELRRQGFRLEVSVKQGRVQVQKPK